MAVTRSQPNWLEIFDCPAIYETARLCAMNSHVRFVRSQDELALWNPLSKGRVFTAKEAFSLFGEDILRKVWEENSALLPSDPSEPSKTIRERRLALGLSQNELAKSLNLDLQIIERAESPDYKNSIHDISKIATVLGLDDTMIAFRPEPSGQSSVAVRLKAWSNASRRAPTTVAKLSEISWVIRTQCRLQTMLSATKNLGSKFIPSNQYGDYNWPAWDVAAELALTTRKIIGLTDSEPIPSTRQLCFELGIPLVHVALPKDIAGATLAVGTARGIVLNVAGNNNVWTQRATVAHELGHLLWDPDEQLNALRVDTKEQVEKIDRVTPQDWVEARANAFAVELLAPRASVRDFVSGLIYQHGPTDVASALRDCMEHFGLSFTAMRYHLWNSFDRKFDIDNLPSIDTNPTDEWTGQESYADDMFNEVTLTRRGKFAGVVVNAEQEGWLTDQTAAFYLGKSDSEYRSIRPKILELYPV